MLNPTLVMAEALGDHLEDYYRQTFGPEEPTYPGKLNLAARMALEVIANSDALYHDLQHTMLVTLVGQEILRGRHLESRLAPDDWLHFTVATLCHDIGYIRGVCSGDTATSFVIDDAGNRVSPPRGASDAFLTPYHVDRGKIFVRERCGPVPFLDEERVAKAIELADLIGQLADPNYLQKLNALYYEFAETGTAEKLGITDPADLADRYPEFYWNTVQPYVADAIFYLQLTQEGKQWVANLHSHVFALEHQQFRFGPFPGDE
jgi:hypothetical protein